MGRASRLFRAYPVRSTAIVLVLAVLGWYGATQTGDNASDWEDGVVTAEQRDLHVTAIVNEAPEDLLIRIVTPWDMREVQVPGRQEAGVVWFIRCEEPVLFDLQITAWRPNGDLVRDERFEAFSCPKEPQAVTVRDEMTHYRLELARDPFMPA